MKILFIHADYLNYKVREKTKFAEEVGQENRAGGMRDPLIAFTCVEKADELVNGPVERAVVEIQDIASRVKAKNIVIFPFAHLSCELGSPKFAIQLLTSIETKLKGAGYRILRVPFGWYNVFEFKSKGPPACGPLEDGAEVSQSRPYSLPPLSRGRILYARYKEFPSPSSACRWRSTSGGFGYA